MLRPVGHLLAPAAHASAVLVAARHVPQASRDRPFLIDLERGGAVGTHLDVETKEMFRRAGEHVDRPAL